MKYLLIIPLLISRAFCQEIDCNHQIDIVLNLSAGGPWNTYAEVGALGLAPNIGMVAGIIQYRDVRKGKALEDQDQASFYLRPSYTVLRLKLNNGFFLRGYATALFGPNVKGISARLGIGDDEDNIMLSVEPAWIAGLRVNVTLLIRF